METNNMDTSIRPRKPGDVEDPQQIVGTMEPFKTPEDLEQHLKEVKEAQEVYKAPF